MFGLNGIEIAVFALTICAIALSLAAIHRGGDLRLGLAAILAAVVLPVLGPVLALLYAGIALGRTRRSHHQEPHTS